MTMKDSPLIPIVSGPYSGRSISDPEVRFHEEDVIRIMKGNAPTNIRQALKGAPDPTDDAFVIINENGEAVDTSGRKKCYGKRHEIWEGDLP